MFLVSKKAFTVVSLTRVISLFLVKLLSGTVLSITLRLCAIPYPKIGDERCSRMFIVEQPSIPPPIFVFPTQSFLLLLFNRNFSWLDLRIRIRQPSNEALDLEQETEKRRLTTLRVDRTGECFDEIANLFPGLLYLIYSTIKTTVFHFPFVTFQSLS